jgi:hypothetical protein
MPRSNLVIKTCLLEPSLLQGQRDDVEERQEGTLQRDIAQEPCFPLVQLEMMRLQVAEARSLTLAMKALVFCNISNSWHLPFIVAEPLTVEPFDFFEHRFAM